MTMVLAATLAVTACAGFRMKHGSDGYPTAGVGSVDQRFPASIPLTELRRDNAVVVSPALNAPATSSVAESAAVSRTEAEAAETALVSGAAIPAGQTEATVHGEPATDDPLVAPHRAVAMQRIPLRTIALAGILPPWPAAFAAFAALAASTWLLDALLRRRSRRRTHMTTTITSKPQREPEAPKVETIAASTIWVASASSSVPVVNTVDALDRARLLTVAAPAGAPLLFVERERSSQAYVVDQRVEAPINVYTVSGSSVPPDFAEPGLRAVAIAPAVPVHVFSAAHVAAEPDVATSGYEVVEPVVIQTPPAMPERPATPAPAATAPWEDARLRLECGDYHGVLEQLSGSMIDPQAPVGVWVMAARAWWCIAQESGDPHAYERAAEAMEHMLEREPERPDVWSRMGRCRLLQAGGESGHAGTRTLDIAIVALHRAVELEAEPDPALLADLGLALLQRAARPATDRSAGELIADAVTTLRQAAACAPENPASPEAWLLQQALQAQAATRPRADAAKLRTEVDALLLAGQRAAPEASQTDWYVARVDNELAHAELAQGATRTLHLRTLRAAHQSVLAGPEATPAQLICWLRVLSTEIAHLRGDVAAARFAEGINVLERLDAACPDSPDVAHARACMLRQRAMQLTGNSRLLMLSEALQGLLRFVDLPDRPALRLLTAELLLERATVLPGAQATEARVRSIELAWPLVECSGVAAAALCCVIEAQLALEQAVDPGCRERLHAMAMGDTRACNLLARAALRNDEVELACDYFELAAKTFDGPPDAALIRTWTEASHRWGEQLSDASDRHDWQRNRQRLRAAG